MHRLLSCLHIIVAVLQGVRVEDEDNIQCRVVSCNNTRMLQTRVSLQPWSAIDIRITSIIITINDYSIIIIIIDVA